MSVRRFTAETRNIIINLYRNGKSYQSIVHELRKQTGVVCSRQGVRKAVIKYKTTGGINVSKRKTDGRHRKLTHFHGRFINMWLSTRPDLTAKEVKKKLLQTFGVTVSESLIVKVRQQLGWTMKRTSYCQMISAKNCLKREKWCLNALTTQETFRNVIFMDETTVEMASHGRLIFYQRQGRMDTLPSKAPKPKHSYKVHVWGGISYRGRTDCCIFTGIMDSVIYQKILERNLLPFVHHVFPEGFRLYQDNDSKHVSKSTKEWMNRHGIDQTVMEVPASSPDLNPIENLWSTLKDFLQQKIKPKKKEELVSGIVQFWRSLSAAQCGRYIDHIHKVIPEVVLNRGGPTQY